MAELARLRRDIEAKGTQLAFVHMGDAEHGRALFAAHGLGDVPAFSDPEGRLYDAFGLRRVSFAHFFNPRVMWRGLKSILGGHGQGKMIGDPLRMPGVFLLHKGRIVRAFRHASASDRPDYLEQACPLPQRM